MGVCLFGSKSDIIVDFNVLFVMLLDGIFFLKELCMVDFEFFGVSFMECTGE